MTDTANSRPLSTAPEVRERAIAALADDCFKWSDDVSLTDWIEALRQVHLNDNGFEIAKDLERYSRVYGIDAELVEVLDSASSYLWDAHRAAVISWVAETGVKPTLSVGDRIEARRGTGTISGFVADQGCYLMIPDGEEEKFACGGGVYVPYEIATPQPGGRPA